MDQPGYSDTVSRDLSERLVSLPLWLGIESELEWIVGQIAEAVDKTSPVS
ncbi:MAG: hypothetical protein LJE92_13730 [Gammaproteobacteria bacterium]|jgi:hypothetical protein|nr:hypothetical protein [Gammaproteobacteria bacterium]